MRKRVIKDPSIFLVENFLSVEECQHWINIAEEIGFKAAPITTSSGPLMRPDIRNNTRIMHDSKELAQDLYQRAQEFLVPFWYGRDLTGFNERFRFYKYGPGERFAPHYDGRFDRGNGERSEFTFLIYLNDDYTGGQTRFFDPDRVDIDPKAGTVLVFRHAQLHEGAVVESGIKYVLRTDVMYRKLDGELSA